MKLPLILFLLYINHNESSQIIFKKNLKINEGRVLFLLEVYMLYKFIQ